MAFSSSNSVRSRLRAAVQGLCPFPGRIAVLALVAGAGAVLLLASCRNSEVMEAAASAADEGITKHYERGPVRVTVTVSRKEISIAERTELTLAVTVSEDYDVELPRFGEKLEQFGIVDYRTPQPESVEDGHVLLRKSYVLEPFLSGEYTISPMTIRFWEKAGVAATAPPDAADPGAGEPAAAAQTEGLKKHELETEAMTIKVTSLLPETLAELKIEDIAGPVELPRPPRRWAWALLAALGLGAAAAGGVTWYVRRRVCPESGIPAVPAHELAFDALEALVAAELVAQGRVKEFYQHISHILRHYIENRFGLHAPERTTEEFLDELRSAPARAAEAGFVPSYGELLTTFLTHCDLVKFAELQPGTQEIQATFDSCKTFIVETCEPPRGTLQQETSADAS